QDASAGIQLYSYNAFHSLNVGDEVQVTGEIDQYRGKTEIIPSDSLDIVVLSTGNPLPAVQVVTIPDVGEDYEAELIQINGVWLADPTQWPTPGNSANVDLTDGADTLTIRIDSDTDIDENAAPAGNFDLVGIGGQFTYSTPPNDGYQIQPRFYTDFIPEPIILFKDDFEAYTAGIQLVVQNPIDWTAWSGTPGVNDPFVSNAHANSGVNSVNIILDDDLVKVMPNYDSGVFTVSFELYIPTGTVAYFNTLQNFNPTPVWGMQVYFRAGGFAEIDADGALSANFTYSYDTWLHNEVLVDLDNDTAIYSVDGQVIKGWKWSNGTFGTPGPVELGGSNFYGGGPVGAFDFYVDDYCIAVEDSNWIIIGTGDDEISLLPKTFDMKQNYPNPFNPTTTIEYQLPKKSDVKIVIYNVLGQAVRTLVDNSADAGYHQKVWDGMNDFGNRAATGIYFYRMVAKDFVKSKKMILMK
ncbi:MAG: T9SS type A sorting domain-containing protein, partial [Gammaproteobacteria bacterium]|nr:T9SS type A sorting domain-containing protein [Gammaproteobacteria bacterium]